MSADLSPLEQAAARVGLPGLKARVVPYDRRRGWWFRWGGGELLVSDRIIDRCTPADATALLVSEVVRRRRVEHARYYAIGPVISAGGLAVISTAFDHTYFWGLLVAAAGLAATIVMLAVQVTRAAEKADDQTVRLLGDATPLVRGLNEMNFEELHIAGKILPARPDLHRRAERLVRLHGLCEAQPPA